MDVNDAVNLRWYKPWHWPALLRGEPWLTFLELEKAQHDQARIDMKAAQAMANALAERCHGQSEILSRRAAGQPVVVCLCGSTRFRKEYEEAFHQEEHAGKICLTAPCFKDDPCCKTTEAHARLDELHLRKIEMASEVLVIARRVPHCLDCGRWFPDALTSPPHAPGCQGDQLRLDRYVGESTAREIEYAMKLAKIIRYYGDRP